MAYAREEGNDSLLRVIIRNEIFPTQQRNLFRFSAGLFPDVSNDTKNIGMVDAP